MACSASMKAAIPPRFWASATTCNAIVVLPLDSGPENLHHPSSRHSAHPQCRVKGKCALVGMISTGTSASFVPKRMIEPLPNCFSICVNARSMALIFSVLAFRAFKTSLVWTSIVCKFERAQVVCSIYIIDAPVTVHEEV